MGKVMPSGSAWAISRVAPVAVTAAVLPTWFPVLLAAAVGGAAEAVLADERLAVTVAARRIRRYRVGLGVFFPLGLGVRVTVGVAVGVLVGVDVTVGAAVGGAGVCVGAVLPQAGPVTVSE